MLVMCATIARSVDCTAGGDVLLLARSSRRATPGVDLANYAGIFPVTLTVDTTSIRARSQAGDDRWSRLLGPARPFFIMADLAGECPSQGAAKPGTDLRWPWRRSDAIDTLFRDRTLDQWPECGAAPRCPAASSAHHWSPIWKSWCASNAAKLSRGNEVAKAMEYMLKRWTAFTRFLDDGRICLSNNAERALPASPWVESRAVRRLRSRGQRAAAMYSTSSRQNERRRPQAC